MTFRARLLMAITIGALVPLALVFGFVRRDVARRITSMYDRRLADERIAVHEAIAQESATIDSRLRTLIQGLESDDRFRVGAVRREVSERPYVLDYAARAMRLTGLSMLQVQDETGRILSSGHFAREYDRMDDAVVRQLANAGTTGAITRARTPEGPFVVLARVDSFAVMGKRFYLVGGTAIDSLFLARFRRGDSVSVSLVFGDATADTSASNTVPLPFADPEGPAVQKAQFVIMQSRGELAALLREANRWFGAAIVIVVLGIIALSLWLSHRLSQPLADLATAASRIDLDGEVVSVAAAREDEIGTLARRLTALTQRLGASAERLRIAERRATVGDMARQVNHDIKNGLIPIRNVLRHLGEVSEREPAELTTAFSERRGTLDASVSYLDTLARNYARLTPRIDRTAVDVNAVAREAAATATVGSAHKVRTQLALSLPPITGDCVVLRRILDNLIRNGLESLDGKSGEVTVTSARSADDAIRLTVSDTGRGMSADEVAHAFDDFFTTKEAGAGLGLSVVRRLAADLGGSVTVESEPGRGTTFTLELPV